MATYRLAPNGTLEQTIQANRRANLRRVTLELDSDGIESNLLIDQLLGLRTGVLSDVRKGAEITDIMAREIEWAMNRPSGWLDRDPGEPDI